MAQSSNSKNGICCRVKVRGICMCKAPSTLLAPGPLVEALLAHEIKIFYLSKHVGGGSIIFVFSG
jgi:hypothetical protein